MLLHIVPKLYTPFGNTEFVSLVDLKVEPFGLELRGGIDLVTRRPYPNKNFVVACRKEGRRAINGLLLEVPRLIDFEYTARWAVEASFVSTHRVKHHILDTDYEAASEDMLLWHGCSPGLGGWSRRWPDWAKDFSPAVAQPMMEIAKVIRDRPFTVDTYEPGGGGWLALREQAFDMPTIEPGRLENYRLDDRLPPLSSAFSV